MTYVATMDTGASVEFATITEARRWAERFGATADECRIGRVGWVLWGHSDAAGTGDWHGGDGERPAALPRSCRCISRATAEALVAVHRRDTAGDGTRWFKATP